MMSNLTKYGLGYNLGDFSNLHLVTLMEKKKKRKYSLLSNAPFSPFPR
jgi:hypothetical protein